MRTKEIKNQRIGDKKMTDEQIKAIREAEKREAEEWKEKMKKFELLRKKQEEEAFIYYDTHERKKIEEDNKEIKDFLLDSDYFMKPYLERFSTIENLEEITNEILDRIGVIREENMRYMYVGSVMDSDYDAYEHLMSDSNDDTGDWGDRLVGEIADILTLIMYNILEDHGMDMDGLINKHLEHYESEVCEYFDPMSYIDTDDID
jgi:hypothetical protein